MLTYVTLIKNLFVAFFTLINLHFHLVKEAYPSKTNRFGRRRRGEKMYVLLLEIAKTQMWISFFIILLGN